MTDKSPKKRAYSLALALLLSAAAVFAFAYFLRLHKDDQGTQAKHIVRTYLVAETEESFYLVGVDMEVSGESAPALAAVEELIKGPQAGSSLELAVPSSVRVLGLEVIDGTCWLNLSMEIIEDREALDPCEAREELALGAIVDTLTEIEGIEEVVLLVEGLREGKIDGVAVEDFWGYCGLGGVLKRREELIGFPGITKRKEAPSVWKSIDRQSLADSLGWGEVSIGNVNKMRIALTLDAGASGEPTPAILDTLKAADVHSTFFLTGQFVDTYPNLVMRIAKEGHEIANRSNTHPEFTKISRDEARLQIEATEKKVRELTGLSTSLTFRFTK